MLLLAGVFVPAPAPQTWMLATWPALWAGQPWSHGILWKSWAEMTGRSGLFIEVPLCRLAFEVCCHLWGPQGFLPRACRRVSCLPRDSSWDPGAAAYFLILRPFFINKIFLFENLITTFAVKYCVKGNNNYDLLPFVRFRLCARWGNSLISSYLLVPVVSQTSKGRE